MAKLVGARVYNSGNISINNAAWTQLTFDTERYDYDTMHDLVVNPSRLTCRTAGLYLIIANVEWQISQVGRRLTRIILNGATWIGGDERAPQDTGYAAPCVSTIYELAISDYVELDVYQSSGGALNIVVDINFSPEFMMSRIG